MARRFAAMLALLLAFLLGTSIPLTCAQAMAPSVTTMSLAHDHSPCGDGAHLCPACQSPPLGGILARAEVPLSAVAFTRTETVFFRTIPRGTSQQPMLPPPRSLT